MNNEDKKKDAETKLFGLKITVKYEVVQRL